MALINAVYFLSAALLVVVRIAAAVVLKFFAADVMPADFFDCRASFHRTVVVATREFEVRHALLNAGLAVGVAGGVLVDEGGALAEVEGLGLAALLVVAEDFEADPPPLLLHPDTASIPATATVESTGRARRRLGERDMPQLCNGATRAAKSVDSASTGFRPRRVPRAPVDRPASAESGR